jgi:hypothetical protein
VPEVFGHLRPQRGFQHILVNSFKNPSGPVNTNPRCRASATIAAAAACSGVNPAPADSSHLHVYP